MNTYCIKKGYKPNKINITNDVVSDGKYWNAQRIAAAEIYQFPVYEFASNYIKKNKVKKLMDIGCGVGVKLAYLRNNNQELKIIGVDQASPIEYCKKTYDFGEWYADDFEDSKLKSDLESELIICSDVVEHLINPDLLFKYIKTKLSPGGAVIFSTPERDALRGKECDNSPNKHHVREWNFNEFEEYLSSQGFEIESHFLQYPVKFKIGRIYFHEIIMRAIKMKPLKYNQVVVARVRDTLRNHLLGTGCAP